MKPYYENDGVVVYHGDAREIIPSLGEFDAVVTDPVWPNGKAEIAGKDDPEGLLKETLAICHTRRFVIHLGSESDPRILRSVPENFPFIRACWLDLSRPHYNGLILAGSEIAYVFGEFPKRQGWMVLPGMCRDSDSKGKQSDHPCPRKLTHVKWLCRYYAQGRTLDPFMGSGTTAIACKWLGIPFVGIEIEERFCEMAAERLTQHVFDFEGKPLYDGRRDESTVEATTDDERQTI